MNKIYIERTPWHDEGFASKAEEKESVGGETLYRAYGGTSEPLGTCFFMPAIGTVPINYWTAEMLERELNAALWGNEFECVAMFQINPKVKYRIGPIAHDLYAGFEEEKSTGKRNVFVQRSFITPSGIFKQVKIVMEPKTKLDSYVRQIGGLIRIKAGTFSREMAHRAKKYTQ